MTWCIPSFQTHYVIHRIYVTKWSMLDKSLSSHLTTDFMGRALPALRSVNLDLRTLNSWAACAWFAWPIFKGNLTYILPLKCQWKHLGKNAAPPEQIQQVVFNGAVRGNWAHLTSGDGAFKVLTPYKSRAFLFFPSIPCTSIHPSASEGGGLSAVRLSRCSWCAEGMRAQIKRVLVALWCAVITVYCQHHCWVFFFFHVWGQKRNRLL